MEYDLRQLGRVKLVQLQPSGLITETPSGCFYDASRRAEVDHLRITPLGIEATNPEGERVRLPVDKLKETLQFLGNGRRGFLLVMGAGQTTATVRPGDKVFAVSTN